MKALIDKWYNDNYSNILDVTEMHISRMGKNVDAVGLISNAYIYVLSKNPCGKTDIERMTYGFIWRELSNWNSKTNRDTNFIEDEIPVTLSYNENTDILLIIDIEEFEKTLTRLEKIIWDVYYRRGLTKKRELAQHFNIDDTSAWLYMKEIKTKFKEYVKTEKGI